MTFKSKKPMRSKLLNSLINLIKEKLLFNFSFGASFKLKELERSMSPPHTCAHMLTHRGMPPTYTCAYMLTHRGMPTKTHVHTCSPTKACPLTHTCVHTLTHRVHGSLPENKIAQLPSRVKGIFPVSGERKSNLHPFSGRQTMQRMAFSLSMI